MQHTHFSNNNDSTPRIYFSCCFNLARSAPTLLQFFGIALVVAGVNFAKVKRAVLVSFPSFSFSITLAAAIIAVAIAKATANLVSRQANKLRKEAKRQKQDDD